ncbi:MAG: VacB/RNase II family 3'-5' exoribonuclease [Cyanobacteria bacterium]|nr:VacB/RNase II family 3'-5' exoribonuclease [Cyanobacteria bacterium CG_2015-16_32_12]NCO77090.1 VacB/RNase II family 3'-5' exoribonuclease [Cyanobacteria bacterium CG_2015-22_32_23]NCQ04135.1 VacB/RNase II family 3'-5' exoribonuclease [Cyanobacteria bacterium CG_2015-09_32_10]NCQ41542.1 VacB/RNase II family 3'-5' exoribonuclease [Cyanobacteria bacterium CG_2015-04_32_10]NCS84334.1 VacB/RNase II family 3'-5' exoribonuclease [Cyanobacteria bacterium CG_2015-02_32_10]
MEKGTLVEFRVNGDTRDRRLAVVEKPEGKKDWIVIDEKGNPHKIRPQRVDYQIKGQFFKYSEIPQFKEEIIPYLDESNLEIAWELLVEDSTPVTPSELASLIFSEETPAVCYAAHILLSDDKIYFKRKGDIYEPRSFHQVEEIKHQIDIERQKKEEKEGFINKLKQALQGESFKWEEGDSLKLNFLEKYALQPDNPPKQAQDILESLGRQKSGDSAVQLLIDLKLWDKHENIFLRRSSYPNYFPLQVSEVAHSLLEKISAGAIVDLNPRLDLTHQKVYTIDDESTEEIDDGLSVETQEDGTLRYWIHIADPTRLINPDDSLDREARKRSTSLYLPTGMIPMFPPELATGPMSLIQGQICPALSFGVTLKDDGAVLDYKIHATLIKPTYRLTYHDVDEMLHLDIQAEKEVKQLAEASKKRSQWRKDNGSVMISMPEAIIKVKDNEDVTIELLDPSFSRSLVAEMMILAGEVAGRYCQEHSIPVAFRSQPQPELPPEEELILLPPGPVRSCALRRCMPKSETGLSAARHASLGLETYTQVTSPIRRYTDLLAHFQIKAHLRGDDFPFQRDQMQEIIFEVMSTSSEAVLVERQTNRYWSLQYLQKYSNEIWHGLVLRWLREDDNLALILLEDLGLEFAHRFDRIPKIGEQLKLQVHFCDPQRDEIRFKEAISN